MTITSRNLCLYNTRLVPSNPSFYLFVRAATGLPMLVRWRPTMSRAGSRSIQTLILVVCRDALTKHLVTVVERRRIYGCKQVVSSLHGNGEREQNIGVKRFVVKIERKPV